MSSTPTTTTSSSSSNIGGGGGGQFGDTTYTKVFVGGLAWETQKDTMNKYFEQFGEILEAVVIYDKNTGRSKGYGFVTFKEAEAARKACEDPAPVIDGRRANCNLASLGLQRSRPSTPQHGRGRSFGGMKGLKIGFQQGGVGTAFSYTPTLPHYAIQQGIPFPLSGYSPYYPYPMSYYSSNGACGGSSNHYFVYGGVGNGTMGAANPNYYPYFHYGQSFDIQYPQQQQFQYPSASLHHFHGGHIPFTPLPPSQSGAIVTTALPPPTVQALAPHYSNQTNSLHPISSI